MTTPDSPEARAFLGAEILKHYQHPDSWTTGNTTGRFEYRDCMLLRVEEVRLGSFAEVAPEEAKLNADCIVLFLQMLGLGQDQIWLVSEPNRPPYLVVPTNNGNWDVVMSMLRHLSS